MGRIGEKIGWIGGWLGGFLWIAILSVVFLFQEKWSQGLIGILLTIVSVAVIIFFAPWRFPTTPYRKLMIAPYGMLFLTVLWAIWSYGGPASLDITWWNMLWLLPLLIPLGTTGNRSWVVPNTGLEHTKQTAKPGDS